MNYVKDIFELLSSKKIINLGNFSLIKISGEDSETFLQNQTTNNVLNLKKNEFQTTSLLTNKGIVETIFLLWKDSTSTYWALVESSFLDQTLARLNKYLVSEDVELVVQEHNLSFVIGSNNGEAGSIYGNFMGELGYLTPIESNTEFSKMRMLKTLSGYPVMSIDFQKPTLMNNSTLIYYGYDNKKGCFPGNETISKIESRKGAGFKDSLLYFSKKIEQQVGNSLRIDGRKIGTIKDLFLTNNESYLIVDLLREFRISKKLLKIDNISEPGMVYDLPIYESSEKAQYFYDYGVEVFQNGEESLALKYFELAIKFNPNFSDAYESMAVLLGRLEKFEEAIEVLENLLKVDKKSVMAHTNLSMFHMKLGNIEIAEEHKSLATINTFEKFGEEQKIKKLKLEKEQQEEAELLEREKMFYQVLEIDSEDPLANYGIGEISFKRKEYGKAQGHLEMVLSTDPKYSVAYLLLAKVFRALGNNKDTLDTLNRGIEVAAKNGDLMPANEMQSILNQIKNK